MKDFFISYTRPDRTWAEWIAWQLEEAGYTTIIQAWDFRPGSNFGLEMYQAAQETARTIAVLSPDYLDSRYTPSEWVAAFVKDPKCDEGKLLPVIIREVELGSLLSAIVHIDLVGKDEAVAKEELLAGVKRGRAKPSTEPVFPGVRSIPAQPNFPGPLPVELTEQPEPGSESVSLTDSLPVEPPKPRLPTPKLRWRNPRTMLLTIAALLPLVALPKLLHHFWPSPASEYKDHFLADQMQWSPTGIGWELERKEGRIIGRRISGNDVGLFKDRAEARSYDSYHNVTLRFRVRLLNGRGVAWIMRAQDLSNYYLFELATSKSSKSQRGFNFYKYVNGQRQFLNNLPVGDYIDKNDFYFITVVATSDKFVITIEVFRDDSGPHCLGAFTDSSFREGGIGFRPVDGMDWLLQQFTVMTETADTECPYKK